MKNKLLYGSIFIIIILLVILIIIVFKNFNDRKTIGVGEAGISVEEFNQITNGMSNFEVNDIIDPNSLLDDDETYNKCVQEISNTENNHIYSYTMRYQGENAGYAEITFTADYSNGDIFVMPTVSGKINYNLK